MILHYRESNLIFLDNIPFITVTRTRQTYDAVKDYRLSFDVGKCHKRNFKYPPN